MNGNVTEGRQERIFLLTLFLSPVEYITIFKIWSNHTPFGSYNESTRVQYVYWNSRIEREAAYPTPTCIYTLNNRVTDFPLWWKLDAYEFLTATGTTPCTLAFEFHLHSAISSHAFSIPLRSPWRHKSLAEIQSSWDSCVSIWFYITYLSSISPWKTLYELGFIFFLYRPVISAAPGPYKWEKMYPSRVRKG